MPTGPDFKGPKGDPKISFWATLLGRRSVRRFKSQRVPRELLDQIVHAGTWAPSSCNYQMWDLVVVDDPEVNHALGQLSTQMANAPVNIVISYGRDFSEEGFANIQSASALIQNMSLAAHALGLGSFWITAMGGVEHVRETVGLPRDRLVVAVLAVGWPDYPKDKEARAPKRRALDEVRHFNHYGGRPIPSSTDPDDWDADLLAIYQRARALNGLRHNKPRPWEVRALETALDVLVPEGTEKSSDSKLRWLDVLPCTGILVERLSKRRRGFTFDVAERSRGVARFAGARTRPKAGLFQWVDTNSDGSQAVPIDQSESSESLPTLEPGVYDLVSCIFRLEGFAPAAQVAAFKRLASLVRPGGSLLVAFVSKRSFHNWTERLRARRSGPRGVEYVLSPDPNIGPFQAIDPVNIDQIAAKSGLTLIAKLGLQAMPQPEEIAFRMRNFRPRTQNVVRLIGKLAGAFERLPGVQGRYGRFQFRRYTKP